LRLETRFKIDKKKMNFIFLAAKKIFLTQKGNARVRGRTKKSLIAPADLSPCLGAIDS
jgi:hypothetical protein